MSRTRIGNPLELVDTKKLLVRRSIDQLGFIKDVNSLVVLSGVSLYSVGIANLSMSDQ